jgi:hypothetical protein
MASAFAMNLRVARVNLGMLLLLSTTAAAPTGSCSAPGASTDGGAGGGGPTEGGVADASADDAPTSPVTGDAGDAGTDGDLAPAQDASSGDDAASSPDAPQEAGALPDAGVDAAIEAGGDAGTPHGPVWANWPMPNPPSSGLPNPQSYDTTVAGIVKDKVTGLLWQQTDVLATDLPTVQAAAAYCAGLTLGGYTDWRLPSRIEIWSINDTSRSSPAMDPVFATVAASAPASSPAAAPWTTSLGHGSYSYPNGDLLIAQGDQSVSSITGTATDGGGTVRCVRGSTMQPSPHYTVQGGVVHDNGTQLTWQQGYSSTDMLPNGVAGYCAGLTLAGGGWRAPSVKELETLVDDDVVSPALDTSVFTLPPVVDGGTVDWAFYSSTLVVGTNNSATRDVEFVAGLDGTGTNDLGFVYVPLNVNFHWVRCVR